jgi:hypothetical protein
MKASGRENSAVVEFTGKVQRIACIHQLGLKDKPNYYAKYVRYPKRCLLGLGQQDVVIVERLLVDLILKNEPATDELNYFCVQSACHCGDIYPDAYPSLFELYFHHNAFSNPVSIGFIYRVVGVFSQQ